MPDRLSPEVSQAISDLLKELASELDLHYEDEDFFALSPSIEVMRKAAFLLEQSGVQPPSVYEHVLKRFNRHRN